MRSNNKHTGKELEEYIHLFLKKRTSYEELRNNYGLFLSKSKFRFKVLKYQEHGPDEALYPKQLTIIIFKQMKKK